ncbi:hypothetical protein CBR_g23339 [Chara braunii]|uniref:Reverse transcriptase domain-containing protein n=1 Tax=Chara braunii TaxID=69332 RepID=A0A388L3X0_CHABU|nr:hypothetical protein CBR_g23339 [Chara braunii]|eukprot:GBG77009.1 hypothetical protein CBR_g23339 [Chara braunii]
MADGGRKFVTLDDLIDALDKRERAPSNVPKVETFHFKGDRVSDWLDVTEQALVGLSDEVKLQRVLRYVLHSHHREVTKVVDAFGGSWTKFGDLMRRKYRLGDGLLTMADLEAMNKEDFSTIGAFMHEFKKKARKVHGIFEEAQCATFLGLLTGSEATKLTKYGEGSERLTSRTIDKGVEEGSLDQVEQHQIRLQKRKRKERDATASGTPGVKRIVTDVLTVLGKKYAVRLEEGFDVERMVDKLLEGHNDLMNLKDILPSAPRLCGELKGRLSRRLNLGSFTFEESEYARRGLREEQEEEGAGEVLSLSLNDVNKAMEVVAAHDMADLEAIKALREQAGPCRINNENEEGLIIGEPGFLLPQERTLMVKTMRRRHCAYAFNDDQRGRLNVDKIPMIRIHTVPHEPWNLRGAQYPNPDEEKKVVDYLDGKMSTYVADYSSGPYASPWFCFIKPNGTLRWVQDLQRLNAVTVRDAGGLPNADALSESCAGMPIISLIDLYFGYDQFPVYPPDRQVTAMHTPRGLIHMNVASQGWTNAVAMVQRHMIRVMQTVSPHITQPYIDDLAVKGPKEKEEDEVMPGVRRFVWKHIQDIDQVLGLLEEHNLTASGPKSKHCMKKATILGFVCNEKGRRPDVKKTDKILEWPVPFQSITSVKSFLGTCGFLRSFVKDFATKTEHLRKLRLRVSPRGRDGMPIRLEEGNADEFIPAYEHYMLSLGVAQEEWVQTLLIWTRQAERQVVKQIRERARDWEDCQAQLRRAFGRPHYERHEPRVERRRRSKRSRETAPREVELARERRKAPARQEDEPAEPALAEESFPACGLQAVEFRRITSEELGSPPPLPSAQELDIPRETPFRSLATHLDVSQWEASRLGEGSVEPACYVPLEEPLDPEMETDMRDRGEPHVPEMAVERPDPVRPQGGEVIAVGDDTPPCSPVPEPAQHSWPEGTPEPGSEEIPESPPEATAVPEQEVEMEEHGAGEGARMQAPPDLPSAMHVTKSPVIEEPVPAELPPIVPCASEGMGAEATAPEDQGPRMRGVPRETREEGSARVRVRLDEIHMRQAEIEAAGIEPTPPVEPKTSEQRIDELWARYENQRDAARQRSREAGQADEETSELREMGDLGFSTTRQAIERMDQRICETQVKELEVEHLTTQLAEERARSQTREVEWERRFGEMAATVDRLSAAWEVSQVERASADDQGRGVQASPSQGVAVEVPRQVEPTKEVSVNAIEEEGGAQESLIAMSTERSASRLHQLATAMGIGTPQEGPQRLDAPEHAPRLGELRATLGSLATGTDSGGPDSRQQQQQEVMREPTAMAGSQPSEARGDEVVVTEGPREKGPRESGMPDCRPVSTAARGGEGAEAMEPRPQGHSRVP